MALILPSSSLNLPEAKLNTPDYYNQMLDMLYSGVAIESLVKVLTFTGFMNGLWSPDVAEATKIPLFFWIMAQAANSGLRPRLFNNLKKTDVNTNRIMKNMQPNEYKKLLAETPEAPVAPLPDSGEVQVAETQPAAGVVNQATGLTSTESALLDRDEQLIRQRQRGTV